ncbi:MAG TPA: tRNA (adenosine(37)-N6)-threonylcarbamoyltransferase complex dimerization subunit type 1 TsaB [Gemmatimonadaceae bacterium]|nr:tRNA (adenosine(37)-N6)-threonylcarbamoyltransferase complex dimerization subunit type 1 TsaB [Gemmatimonadaceae bacterium]
MTPSFTIALDGSTYQGSVAVIRDSRVVAERTLGGGEAGSGKRDAGRGDALMPAIAECLNEVAIERDAIARIVCGAGPGSFTSLRVAGSVAKGLAVGYGVDLYAVSSLILTVAGARPPLSEGEYLSVLDAMRGEYFAAKVTLLADQAVIQREPTAMVGPEDLAELAERNPHVRVVGPGQALDFRPHARGVAPLLESLVEQGPVDLASWEPDYGRLAEAQVRWEAAHGRPLRA